MIAVLLIVLIGPFFVDWTEYRKTFEDYAEQVLGQPVTVLGDVDVRLLPVPNLIFADVRVGESENPLATLTSITVVAELPPILKRELVVQELILEQPTLGVGLDEEGQLDWFIGARSKADLDFSSIEVDVVRINNGKVNISDARTGLLHTLEDVNLLGAAQSMSGPFRAVGTVKYAGSNFSVETATGRWQKGEGVQVNTKIAAEAGSVRVDFSGNLSLNGGTPSYEGEFNVSSRIEPEITEGTIPQIWNGEGKFSLNPSEFNVGEANIRFGPEDRAISVQGELVTEFGQNRNFKVNLSAKQVNLDRLIGQGPEEPVATEIATGKVLEFLRNIPNVDGTGTVHASIPSVVVNGSIIQGLELSAISEPTGWSISQLSAQFPGRTRVNSRGDFNVFEQVKYRGSLEMESEQPSTLLSWWLGNPSSENLWLDPVKLTMTMDAGSTGQEFTDIEGYFGEEQFSGSIRIVQNSDNLKRDISVNLKTDLLTFEQIQGISGLLRQSESQLDSSDSDNILNSNIRLRLSVEKAELEEITASSIDIVLNFNEGKLELTNFEAHDIAGTSVDANGSIANLLVNPIGSIELRVDAFDMEKPTSVLGELFPDNIVVQHLKSQPELFSPMRLKVKLSVEPFADESKTILSFSGTVADGSVESTVTLVGSPFDHAENSMDGKFSIESQNVANLLRQIGVNPQDARGLGNASLTARLSGEPNQDLNVDLSLISEEVEVKAVGTVGNFGSKSIAYNLKLDMESNSLDDLTKMAGKNFPVLHGNLPIDFTARIVGEGTEFGLSRINGEFAGVNFRGSLSRSMIRGKQMFRGNLDVTELGVQGLSELILGQGVWDSTESETDPSDKDNFDEGAWPTIEFKPATWEDTRFEFTINAKKLLLSQGFGLSNARFLLTLSPDSLAIDGFYSSISEGKILGSLLIRQSAGEAVLTGNIEIEDVLFEELYQIRAEPPKVKGNLKLKADFETTGLTIASLAKGVTGVGSFSLENGEFSKLNAGAFEQVVADADRGMYIDLENVNKRFSKYLASSSFKFDGTDGHLSISAGQIKLNNVEFSAEDAEIILDGVFDIDEWQLEGDLTIKSSYVDDFGGGSPRVDLGIAGSVGSLEHTIDTSRFVSFLAIRNYEILSRERAVRDEQAQQREEAVQELKELQQEEETENDSILSEPSDSTGEDAKEADQPEESTQERELINTNPPFQDRDREDSQNGGTDGNLPSDSNSKQDEESIREESKSDSNDEQQGFGSIGDLIKQSDNIENSQQQDIEEDIQSEDESFFRESDQSTDFQQNDPTGSNPNSAFSGTSGDEIQTDNGLIPLNRPSTNTGIESRNLESLEQNPHTIIPDETSPAVGGKSLANEIQKVLDSSEEKPGANEGENEDTDSDPNEIIGNKLAPLKGESGSEQ